MPLKIDELYAWISDDADGEGVVAGLINGMWMPLIGADRARVESLRKYAADAAAVTGKKITLARFRVREDVEVVG